MRLLIKFPTRSRASKALQVLREYADSLEEPEAVDWLVNIDDDDETTNNDDIKQQLMAICPERMEVHVAPNKSKVEACNAGMDGRQFDILLLASDDMHPVVHGFDRMIREAMVQHYPDTDGVLFFNDGYRGSDLNTLCIIGRQYYHRFGYIYNPLYKSLYCDNEFMDVANKLKRQTYFDRVIIAHQHPHNVPSSVPYDPLYMRNQAFMLEDERTYEHRRSYPYHLSILICALESRAHLRERMETNLQHQIENLSHMHVQVLVLEDDGEHSVGEKRNLLVQRATGCFACFIDDDDDVSPNYVSIIRDALRDTPDADVVELRGAHYIDGRLDRPFIHSLDHNTYWEDANGFYRPPNHLNVVRTYIMKKFPFVSQNVLEDYDYAMRMARSGMLQKQARIPESETLYYYYYVSK